MSTVVQQPQSVVVTGGGAQVVVSTAGVTHAAVTTGTQGPRGPQGPIGPAGGTALTRTANGPISGHRMVVENSAGAVSYASASNRLHAGRVLGMTLGAAADGDPVDVIRSGRVVHAGWSWVPGLVWLGEDGHLTQTPPATGFVQVVGFTESPTTVFIDLREPYQLSE